MGCTRTCPLSPWRPGHAGRDGAVLVRGLVPPRFTLWKVLSPPALQCTRRTAFFLKGSSFIRLYGQSLGKKFGTDCPRPPRWAVRARPPGAPTPLSSPGVSLVPSAAGRARFHGVGPDHSLGVCGHCGCLFSKLLSGVRR